MINEPYPFALIKLNDPDFSEFKDKDLLIDNNTSKLFNNGAVGETRTLTGKNPHAPQACLSTNFSTTALVSYATINE